MTKKNGSLDPYSYLFWSWGQDIELDDIKDTSSNTAESVNARLNRNAPTSYQTFEAAAEHVYRSHNKILDTYYERFAYNQTPSKKRSKTIEHRWSFLNDECEVFHNLSAETQSEYLIDFLLKCSNEWIEDPTEPLEVDPEN